MRHENYWAGYTPDTGPLLYDPKLQEGSGTARVRLWDVTQRKVVVFPKRELKRQLVSLRVQARSYEDEERLACELRTAIAEYRKWLSARKVTRCYRCKTYLDALTQAACSECGWLRCGCGACGCGYFRAR